MAADNEEMRQIVRFASWIEDRGGRGITETDQIDLMRVGRDAH
jgi:hypothetical protein